MINWPIFLPLIFLSCSFFRRRAGAQSSDPLVRLAGIRQPARPCPNDFAEQSV